LLVITDDLGEFIADLVWQPVLGCLNCTGICTEVTGDYSSDLSHRSNLTSLK